jgi:iron-sulfur cluster assembly protein
MAGRLTLQTSALRTGMVESMDTYDKPGAVAEPANRAALDPLDVHAQAWVVPSRLLAWLARPEPTRKEVSAVLALTDSAVQAVKHIVSSSEEVSETGGLRMVAERAGTQANFQLSVVPLPAEDDEVIEEEGARVFLEPEAASLLDDKVLDASVEQNQVAFTIGEQAEA